MHTLQGSMGTLQAHSGQAAHPVAIHFLLHHIHYITTFIFVCSAHRCS